MSYFGSKGDDVLVAVEYIEDGLVGIKRVFEAMFFATKYLYSMLPCFLYS